MSVGWSAGDILAALKLLRDIGAALQDSGGASSDFEETYSFLRHLSITLQLLNAQQSASLSPALAEELANLCEDIRVPLTAFLDDVGKRFEASLGAGSSRGGVRTAPRKVQWALSTSKKARALKLRLTVPLVTVGIILG